MALTVTLSAAVSGDNIDLIWTFAGAPSVHYVYRNKDGGVWSLIETVSSPLSPESYTDTDVDTNYLYGYHIRDGDGIASNSVTSGRWSNTTTETVVVLDSETDSVSDSTATAYTSRDSVSCTDIATFTVDAEVPVDYSDEVTDTVTCTDTLVTTIITPQTYGYFLGSSGGSVYAYNEDEHGDNGVAINSYWKSKRLDFADEYPDFLTKWKTIDYLLLTYVDRTSHTITLSLSTDGGVTWDSKTKTVGSGSGRVLEKPFHFWKTGRFFNFKITNNSSTENFQWIRLTAHFTPQTEQFATA